MAYNNKELVEQLEERLKWYYYDASEEEFDADDIDAICTVLEKLDSVKDKFPDTETAYRKLMERIEREDAEKAGKIAEAYSFRKRKTGRKKVWAAVIIFIGVFGAGILLLNSYTKAYADKSLFTMILEKAGVVNVRMMGDTEEPVDENLELTETYDSWYDLDIDIKSEIAVPEYIPEGFSLFSVECDSYHDKTAIWANYYNEAGGHLIFYITLCEDETELYNEKMKEDEKIGEYLLECSDENTLYYYYDDEYICLTSAKNCFYRITGNTALEEMIKVKEGLNENG